MKKEILLKIGKQNKSNLNDKIFWRAVIIAKKIIKSYKDSNGKTLIFINPASYCNITNGMLGVGMYKTNNYPLTQEEFNKVISTITETIFNGTAPEITNNKNYTWYTWY